MSSVREFGQAIVRGLGAPAGALATFIEVPFKLSERTVYPDGLLQTTRGSKSWTCLVEVKTGSSELDATQVECYLDVARDFSFDAVLTISNQMAPAAGVHPVTVDRRKVRKVNLHHLSWAEVLTAAVQQRVHRGVSDPDQAWILGELIRYLEHPKSGALDFSDMGSAWVSVRESVTAGTLRASDKGIAEVVSRWEQLLRFATLRLGRELGADVQVQVSRKELADPSMRFAAQAESLVRSGVLTGSIRIPDAVAPIDLTADLRAGRVTVAADVDAPREGKPATRINWLTRQLKDAPDGLRIDAFTSRSRTSTSELLRAVRQDPFTLVSDPKKDFTTFRIAATSPLGTKRGVGRGGFIDGVLASIDGFYAAVIQQIRPWAAKAPQLPRGTRSAVEEAGIDTTPPPLDAVEESESSLSAPAAVQPEPDEVLDGVQTVTGPEMASDQTSSDANAAAAEVEFVSWPEAHNRLDRERVDGGRSDAATPPTDL